MWLRPGRASSRARILLTGGTGFIGRHLVALLTGSEHLVLAPTRDELDLGRGPAAAQVIAEFDPDIIFHLASAGVAAARAHDPALVGEEVAMAAAVVSAAPAGARLIVAGSMSEYGHAGYLSECEVATPITAYGTAKLAAGLYCTAYGLSRGLDVRHARLFGVYGPGEQPQRLFPSLIRSLRNGDPIGLSDGLQQRDFIHVGDACEALIRLANVPASSMTAVVNIGTGQPVRVRDVAYWLADAMDADRSLLKFGARPRSPGDADLLAADVTRLASLLQGAVPPQRLAAGLNLSLVE